jgi:hypothetical protein
MHSNVRIMLRKLADAVPFGSGAFRIFPQPLRGFIPWERKEQCRECLLFLNTNLLINLFINQINSL